MFLVTYPSVALGAVVTLGCVLRWFMVASDRRRTEYVMVAAIFTILISATAQSIADGMSRLRPLKYDLFIYQIDAWFGQPSFALGRIVQPQIWLEIILEIAYGIMANVVAAVIAAYIYLAEAELPSVLKAFGINLLAAPLFYLILPVCGPQFAFPYFPQTAGAIVAHLIPLSAAPNGFPSVHTSTALLILLTCWRWRTGRILGILYLGLIVMATLASGQHYFFDLLAAVPYALLVARVAGLSPRRMPTREGSPITLPRPNEQFQ